MKSSLFAITTVALIIFLVCGHFAAVSYFNARRLKARSEALAVQTRILKHRIGELEQKLRILDRVRHFVKRAEEQRLSPVNWSVYDVNIQDGLVFEELAQIVEQCVHHQNLYFKPIAFHAVVGQKTGQSSESDEGDMSRIDFVKDTQDDRPFDLAVALKGTFLVRH